MVDPKDIYSLAADHAIDLSDQSWVNETDYAIGVDGQINGCPVSYTHLDVYKRQK